jgi:DNA-binding NarL/FixJ family response regulator
MEEPPPVSDVTPSSSNAYDHAAVADALDNITAGLERVMAGFNSLKSLLMPEAMADPTEFDPKDPANKQEVGGLMKFTPRGVEVCYRLFDAGKSRYAVATAMGISFGAAKHRYEAWKKLGGVNRTKQPPG